MKETPTKVLFLDIDGVLATRRAWSNQPEGWNRSQKGEFYLPCQELLEDWLVENPDVSIVLSSTWRKLTGWKARIKKESALILSRIIDETESIGSNFRGTEIASWLTEHPLVHTYALLDDSADFYPEQLLYHVQTEGSIGITPRSIRQLDSIFSGGDLNELR